MRETGLEWRDRPMSDSQVIFCERHGLVYDREWTRGIANNMIDKFVVEVRASSVAWRQKLVRLGRGASRAVTGRRAYGCAYAA